MSASHTIHSFFGFVVCLFSIDGTNSNGLAKYVNDNKHGNCNMKKVTVDGQEHLCLFATTAIKLGDQLAYDYGDDETRLFWRSKVRL